MKLVRENNPYEDDFQTDLRDCKFLGEGNNGFVYLMPDGKVIKIFKKTGNCKKEYSILERVNGNSHFPKVYACIGNYIIRDYVGGECMKDYIKEYGISRRLAVNLMELIEEFKVLEFKKLDIRCRDVYVQEDEFLIVIDPKYSFTREKDFPKHLAKGLKKLEVLDAFLKVVKEERPCLYDDWYEKIKKAGLLK